MTRPPQRSDYRHFPQEYFDLLDRFEREGVVSITGITRKEAISMRNGLYYFFNFLRKSYDSDEYARQYSDIARKAVIRVTPTSGLGEAPAQFEIAKNPLVSFFEKGTKSD